MVVLIQSAPQKHVRTTRAMQIQIEPNTTCIVQNVYIRYVQCYPQTIYAVEWCWPYSTTD